MMPAGATDIESLPEQCRELAVAIPQAALALAQRSLLDLNDGRNFWGSYPLLRSSSVALRFYWSKRQNRVVFFLVKQEGLEEVLLEAATRFEVRAVAAPGEEPVLRPDMVRVLVRVPWVFVPAGFAAEKQRLSALLGAGVEDVLFFRYESGVIAVNPDTREIAWPSTAGRLKPGMEQYAWPLLAIARNLGFWIRQQSAVGVDVAVSEDALREQTDFRRMLASLSQAWCEAVNAVERRGGDGPQAPASYVGAMTPSYAVQDFMASFAMRLGEDGNVQFREQEDLFRLAAAVAFVEDDKGDALARLDLRPPDFLLSGPVYEALLNELESDEVVGRLVAELQPLLLRAEVRAGQPANEGDGERMRRFLRAAREDGSGAYSQLVFRTQRGHRTAKSADTNLFVMNGPMGGIPQVHLVLRAKVRVASDEQGAPSAAILAGDENVSVLFCSHLERTPRLEEMTDYFRRLFRQLHRWYGVAAR